MTRHKKDKPQTSKDVGKVKTSTPKVQQAWDSRDIKRSKTLKNELSARELRL